MEANDRKLIDLGQQSRIFRHPSIQTIGGESRLKGLGGEIGYAMPCYEHCLLSHGYIFDVNRAGYLARAPLIVTGLNLAAATVGRLR
jgi:hypothetical protein